MVLKTKYRKLISEEIIGKSKYPEITAPIVKYRGDRGGSDLTFDWSCISKPLVMSDEPNVNDFDQFMFFVGSNLDDFDDFQAEIELPLGKEGKKQIINERKFVYIPSGLVHGPVNFKRINKPIVYMNLYLSPEHSKKWDGSTDYGKYVLKPPIFDEILETKITAGGRPFREQKIRMYLLGADGRDCGRGNIRLTYYSIKEPFLGPEPVHSHSYDMWIIYLGGDPMNVEEFDAEIELQWGEEREKVTIDSACVVHKPGGLIHSSVDHRRVGKPYMEIMVFISPNYFTEGKTVYSKEGELMISKGARDYEISLHKRLKEG